MTVYLGDKAVGANTIVEKEVAKTKFGVSIDDLLGETNENGLLLRPTKEYVVDFSGVTEVTDSVLYYAFAWRNTVTSVICSSLKQVGQSGMDHAFYGCAAVKTVVLSSLERISGNYGLNYAFDSCISITSVDLSSLTRVEGNYGLGYTFNGCSRLTAADLSSLEYVAYSGAYGTFKNTRLEKISFPSLTTVSANSFGTTATGSIFNGCLQLTEIHFRADMQTTIEAMDRYSYKFGASNATIYFDLIGTITVGGVAYARNEPNSIRVDTTKTHVAWADESDNIVYTDATAEPAVGTVVYSDAGTTQVGTVEGVA